MKLTFLGTAAAEGIPGLWCECPVCANARKVQGKERRRRSGYLIDCDTLVEFGPDIFWQTEEFGIDLTEIRQVIITHPHADHLSPAEFVLRKTPYFSQVTHEVALIAPAAVLGEIVAFCARDSRIYDPSELSVKMRATYPGDQICEGDLDITMLAADHAPGLDAQLPLISRNGKTLLIASDTGWLPKESWTLLEGRRIDALVIESTGGIGGADWSRHHLGLHSTVAMRDRLVEMGVLPREAPVIATHFSHNGGNSHQELEAAFSHYGIRVAYDGMVFEI